MYLIQSKNKKPLHVQLYTAIKNDIIANYNVGQKLHSIRKVAATYNLSKNTVETAYSQLVAEGYIESIPKSGYVVCDSNYEYFQRNTIPKDIQTSEEIAWLYDFFPARLGKSDFPLKIWKRLFNKVIDESLDFGAYSQGQGELGLRKELTQYLVQSRGVVCDVSQVVVCNGFGDSMTLLAKMLKKEHNCFAMEEPGYYVANSSFEDYGYEMKRIYLNEHGILIDALKKSQSKLVYITPSHQYPTGRTMPISNRIALLDWAKSNNALIIEDDYDSELNYKHRPIPSLQGLDANDCVIYMGTFSKALSPALRISYMVLPKHLLSKYKYYYDAQFSKVPLMMQKTLEAFMSQGHWERHLRRIRTLNRKKHDLMEKLLMEKLGSTMKIESRGAGLSILINPTVSFDWERFKELANKKRIKVYFAKEKSGGNWQAIRMGFGGFELHDLEPALEIFSFIWHKSIIQ